MFLSEIVRLASVGVEDMFEIVVDAEDILRSPVGDLLRALGITEQPWFRHGEIIPPIARGKGFGPGALLLVILILGSIIGAGLELYRG